MNRSIVEALSNGTVAAVAAGGYFGILVLMGIGCACVPIPSEVVMLAAGSLAARAEMSFWGAVVAGTVGCTLGSILAYWVGYYGGRPLVQRYRKYLLMSARDLSRADSWFERYGDATVFFSRNLPIIRAFISVPAGVARMPFLRFCLYTFLGSIPWCLGLTYVGYRTGRNWDRVTQFMHDFDVVILVAGGLLLIAWVWRHIKHLREEAATGEEAASNAEPH